MTAIFRLILVVILVLVLNTTVQARESSLLNVSGSASCATPDKVLDGIIFKSNEFPKKSEKSQKLLSRLIKLLEKESNNVRTCESLSQSYVEYYGDLISVVTQNIDNISGSDRNYLMKVLLIPEVLVTGGMVTDALSKFGDSAVNELILRYNNTTDQNQKVSLIVVFYTALSNSNLQQKENLDRIKELLLQSAHDVDPYVRMGALRGLIYFDDPDAYLVIKNASLNDQYPVREEAERLLSRKPGN
jgi:HEAT repeat protein